MPGMNDARKRLISVCAVVVLGLAGLTACGGNASPPSCVDHQDGISLNQRNECLNQVSNWCQQYHPNDSACSDKVFGYVPGKID